MKKIKMQRGITLIALIITIVILLIIAVATIGTVKESGIIGHAQNAASSYTIEQEKERIAVAYSDYQILRL
jgi:Tfp pilus assembly protein PilE